MINGTWRTDGVTIFIDPSHGIQEHSLVHVAEVEDGAYARRIVAGVNACRGISTDDLAQIPQGTLEASLSDRITAAALREGRTCVTIS